MSFEKYIKNKLVLINFIKKDNKIKKNPLYPKSLTFTSK